MEINGIKYSENEIKGMIEELRHKVRIQIEALNIAEENYKHYKDRCKKLERILQKALTDIDWINNHTDYDGACMLRRDDCAECPLNASKTLCGWKHQAEAIALLTGDRSKGAVK